MIYINSVTGKVVCLGDSPIGVRYVSSIEAARLEKEAQAAFEFGQAFKRTVELQDTRDPLIERIFRNW